MNFDMHFTCFKCGIENWRQCQKHWKILTNNWTDWLSKMKHCIFKFFTEYNPDENYTWFLFHFLILHTLHIYPDTFPWLQPLSFVFLSDIALFSFPYSLLLPVHAVLLLLYVAVLPLFFALLLAHKFYYRIIGNQCI